MTFNRLAASMMALSLFAVPAFAQPANDRPVVLAAALLIPPAVQMLLQDDRKPSEMTDQELQARLRQSRKLLQIEALPPDARKALMDIAHESKAELDSRTKTTNADAPSGSMGGSDSVAGTGGGGGGGAVSGGDAGGAGQPKQKQPPIATQIPDDVLAYLQDGRPAGSMSLADLKSRVAMGRRLSKIEGLPRPARMKIDNRLAADQAALTKLQNVVAPEPQPEPSVVPDGNGQGGGNMKAVFRYLNDPRKPGEMSVPDIKAKLAQGDEIVNRRNMPSDVKKQVIATQESLRAELKRRQNAGGNGGGGQVGGNGGSGNGGQVISNNGSGGGGAVGASPGDEAKGRDILADKRDPQTMDVRALRNRVNTIRKLLQNNAVSKPVHDKLYAKLANDRTILRRRMASVTGIEPDANGGGGGMTTGADGRPQVNSNNRPGGIEPAVLQKYRGDRRPPRDLSDDELRLRINITVNVITGNYYPDERYDWQRRLEQDRAQLRERMLYQRAQREARLKAQRDRVILDQQQSQYDDLAAAEANDSELQDVLASAPRRKFDRRYTINDFENRPDLRDAVPRIEIDTIHFGFNEGFVREEEIDNLDRVAEIMERILSSNPNEVFLIEGHTDASGADYYNLGLSRQRAEAVVKALTTYYVIPARNLRTVGYGERFLKIPVDGPEPENRRVSVSRITDVVSAN